MKIIHSLVRVSVVLTVGSILVACGSFSGGSSNSGAGGAQGGSSGGGAAGSSGSSGNGGIGGSAGGPTCGAGSMVCSGTCANLNSDNANCGMCGKACPSGQTCQSGTCACATGSKQCPGSSACIDTSADPANCGSCGQACPMGQVCTAGTCAATCGTGLTTCSGACKNLQTDSSNCGTCGKACTTGQTCMNGTCMGGIAQTVCDVLGAAGNACAAAHSTTRVLVSGYTGPLYQVCKGAANPGPSSCKGTTQDIGSVNGYANAGSQDTFCAGGGCTITKIYDQTPNKNDLEPAPRGGYKTSPDDPAIATDLKTTLNGHAVYGILIKPGIGYRAGCSDCNRKTGTGTATGDNPETTYMVTSQQQLIDGCCFDYGNAETTSHDDGNGTMDATYFGGGVVWGTGSPGGHDNGPWAMGDLENGLYAGWENNQDQNISTNTPLKYDFVTVILVGDSCTGKAGCAGTGTARPDGRFALYGGDATNGTLKTEWDGTRPTRGGYIPMTKQGSIILGIGGDNSNDAGGRWYEGVMAKDAATIATLNALQANIVAAKYGK